MEHTKLFCFPYAGGSATIYNGWKAYFSANTGIEVIPIELAGRGKRTGQPFYSDLEDAVEDIYQEIKDDITDTPYAFFGHSLGGLLIYELAQKIKQLDLPQPLHIFFSGRGAPNIKSEKDKKYHLMDDDEFKQEVLGLGGTPRELFEHPELRELFLPLLRNDFKLSETKLTDREVSPFNCNITVFSGKSDSKISAEQLNGWSAHTNGTCSVHYFNGGHFFLHSEVSGITKLIVGALKDREKSLIII